MLKKLTTASLGLAASLVLPAMVAPAQADGVRSTSCVGTGRSVSCVTGWREWSYAPPAPPTEQELAEIRDRERQWQAICQPVILQDHFGVRRYVYAAPGCEYGRFQ